MIANKYKCTIAIWRKFTDFEKKTYNSMMAFLRYQKSISHPDSPKQTAEQWETTRHNVAYLIAFGR